MDAELPMESAVHVPVLLDETVAALRPRPGGRYLDGTVGLGGHAAALLDAADAAAAAGEEPARLCALDRDEEALALARERLSRFGDRVFFAHSRYSRFAAVLDELGWERLDGALVDIGLSSLQLDTAERGFSFLNDGPLDMRMDRHSGEAPVANLVNRAPFAELKGIIESYGEDPQAGRIARTIVDARARKPIETTGELAELVRRAYPPAWRAKSRRHPATRTFQALRMAVNDELGELERFLDGILSCLAPGGRVAVISFHSLEDRLVKHRMRDWARGCLCPPQLPVCVCGHRPEARVITARPLQASETELLRNPRASSAKLRVAEKVSQTGGVDAAGQDQQGGAMTDGQARYEARRRRKAACGRRS